MRYFLKSVDEEYNKVFELKRPHKHLETSELKRSKWEFCEKNKLNSPYVVRTYKPDDKENEYTVEYCNC